MPLLEDLYERQRAQQISIIPFSYSSQFVNGVIVASTGGITQNISIQADSHFVCRYLNITTYISAASAPIVVNTGLAALTINLFDTGSGRNMLDSPQAIQNLCGGVAAGAGNGSLPFIFPEPWLIVASAVVQITLANLSVQTFPRVDVSLVGFKVFSFGGGAAPAL